MATMTASRTTTSTIAATTVALTAAVAVWQWQQRQRYANDQPEEGDALDTTPREVVMINEPHDEQVSVTKPTHKSIEQEEDSVSLTDRSSASESDDPEAAAAAGTVSDLDKTVDEAQQQEQEQQVAEGDAAADPRDVMKLVLADITRRARPTPEQVKAAGFDADEVPMYVRVVQDLDAVQYTGAVGNGVRCVRAIDPLPKPDNFKTIVQKTVPAKSTKKSILRKKNKKAAAAAAAAATTTTTKLVAEPFVETFQLADGSDCTTPRLASYFEVNIVDGPQEGLDQTTTEKSPCIAVGISLHDFNWERSMPGWNVLSYGYHGDDGVSFFAKHKQTYGPTFGVGDTVGCGIDYAQRRVFYTLNGKFLGYSFELNTTQLSRGKWIPTVGMDSHAAVQYNAAGPFQFDLLSLMKNDGDDTKSVSEETTATERVQL